MSFDRLNQYRIMWVIVYFDLPTETKAERRAASEFRKNLIRDGFLMMQFSVYFRHSASRENAEVHKKRVKNWMPEKGNIIVFEITDAQFGRMEFYKNAKPKQQASAHNQLEMF